jgi:hypothetical protein
MKKLKVKWIPDLKQDFDALTNPRSSFYDEKYTKKILKKYGSLESCTKSDDFLRLS